ncbi:PTS system trehalose-specific EIIBC component [Enterococcus columbae]|uniref:PTS system sucrose-specific EIIBCA component n=1 Tax=Enterococcus columbae DSM 7374 = ATCC 51263 TaxID=1121865 RepID=S1NUP6_9ENTE|nr:PTS system trehalose-specific EIIBC component [Enterococcus columbae]EOT39921.1 PTS system, trehalose-specific IIBC component [Enterococcus columbae DSM 7374 = ATCC 51263]EOW83906.1 PTS system, trehalose-specific IIBC component [Enterococcus columbae DSM 7374 = ATCC 51263]OJG25876.1 PTS system, trehalose-specific IIBC component [Enterococcus columbae DSM 7374 = ATCC 51263]
MGKYEKDARDLLAAIGGKENVSAVTHCATRMRFVLVDPKKADQSKIENIPVVKGMFTNAGQFQVIIGNDVPVFYADFTAISGISGVSKEDAKSVAKQNQNPVQRVITLLAEIFTPLLPAIIVGGLILGFRNILEGVQFGFLGNQTIVAVSPFWNGVNGFLWLPGEAIFHFLPVGITWSITRKMGATEILGIVLGITLVSPQLLNAYAVNGTSAADIAKNWSWDFGFFQVAKIGYQAQVIPAMMAGFLLVYLERFFRKRIPEAVSMIFVPFFSLLPTIIAAHTVLGPIGWKIGSGISWIVNAGLESPLNWLFGGVFGAVYAPLVITGLHHTTLAIDSQLIADFGSTNLWPMICLSNIAQGAAVLAIVIAHRGNKKEEQISVPSVISAWLGVTEPAMFGINLKYVYPFVAAMIGSGLAGMFITIMKVRANAIGVGGLPGILAIKNNLGVGKGTGAQGYVIFLIAMGIAIVVPIVLTLFFRKAGIFNKIDRAEQAIPVTLDEIDAQVSTEAVVNATVAAGTKTAIVAPLTGELLPLAQAKDPVFAQGTMGQGVVIEPSEGKLVAPFDGQVTLLFPTKHAIGLVSDTGVEVLIHVGLDTVELDGKGFMTHVAQGDRVKQGQLLLEVDLNVIKEAGYATQTPVIVTNSADFQVDPKAEKQAIKAGDKVITVTHR